jgi:hypothetical protein
MYLLWAASAAARRRGGIQRARRVSFAERKTRMLKSYQIGKVHSVLSQLREHASNLPLSR